MLLISNLLSLVLPMIIIFIYSNQINYLINLFFLMIFKSLKDFKVILFLNFLINYLLNLIIIIHFLQILKLKKMILFNLHLNFNKPYLINLLYYLFTFLLQIITFQKPLYYYDPF